MSLDDYETEWDYDEPERETIIHLHASLPFIEITQERYAGAGPQDQRFEGWSFCAFGPRGQVCYDNTQYQRGDATEPEMIAFMSEQAERRLIDERGPFFVLRIYLETGHYRKAIDAMLRKHGQSPLWRRAEAAITRRLGVERPAIRMRYRLRGERPYF